MNAQVIPVPREGHGSYSWTGYHSVINRYAIRRGRNTVANIILNDNIPFHPAILNDFCRVLDNTEHDDPQCDLLPISRLGEPDRVYCNVCGHDLDIDPDGAA